VFAALGSVNSEEWVDWVAFGIGALIVGAVILPSVALPASGGIFACGWGEREQVGWPTANGPFYVMAAIGAALWVIGGVAAALLPGRRLRLLLLAYALAYIVALLVFVLVIAPAIWGPVRCVPS
jgi:hypothetical protein